MASAPDRLLIWGAGQHGRVVAEIARAAGHAVLGFVDADPAKRNQVVDAAGARVLLLETELLTYLKSGALPGNVEAMVPAVGDNRIRLMHATLLGSALAPAIVHPRAFVSPSAVLSRGTVVGPMAVINTNARVGGAVIVNTSAIVGHDVQVDDGAHIGAGVVLTGCTRVGARAFVATSATLRPGVTIGADATVGAGAVVLHDVADGMTVVGVPARPLEVSEHGIYQATDIPLAAQPVRA